MPAFHLKFLRTPKNTSTSTLRSLNNTPHRSSNYLVNRERRSSLAPDFGTESVLQIRFKPGEDSSHVHNTDLLFPESQQPGLRSVNKNMAGKKVSGKGDGRLDRKESYKAQRRIYRKEKKRVEKELLSTFKDESIIVLADWLKVRGSLKSWTKLWCVLKPGLLLLYRSQKAKSGHWIGTIILSTCELIGKQDLNSKCPNFIFFSIYFKRERNGENIGAVVQPLPTSHLIFRAPTNAAGKCWLDALELALRCSSLLKRNLNRTSVTDEGDAADYTLESLRLDDSDVERHFKGEFDDTGSVTDDGNEGGNNKDFGSEDEDDDEDEESEEPSVIEDPNLQPVATNYVCDVEEVFGTTENQTEEFSDENKSIVWFLVKQVRPGMDLSRVVLPTFILEPRSFLDKISDYYYHADIISKAVLENDPFMRMKTIVRWYLSGFYKKPKGLKKPYNPILGETFRCCWSHPNGSKTFYIAEQVSHHPPISAFYTTNRQDGFTFSGTILAKSKFYGNSTSAILDGDATLSLLPRGEDYVMTMPYAHCKGILMGTMTMELGGKVTIECEKTGYSTELEFKLRPFLGGGEFTNAVSGRLKLGKETLATIDGHWDEKVMFKVGATEEKTKLEEAQRNAVKARDGKSYVTKLFDLEPVMIGAEGTVPKYSYKHADLRPWDPRNDLLQYEKDYEVCTKTRHKTPMIRTQSIVSVLDAGKVATDRVSSISRRRKTRESEVAKNRSQDSDTSTPGTQKELKGRGLNKSSSSLQPLQEAIRPLIEEQVKMNERIAKLNHSIETCLYQQKERDGNSNINRDLVLLIVLVVMIQAMLNWVWAERASKL
ncbi:oxysterol-binding protein-related protein 8 [Eurytemora carolleeae]|uniref:oxysterol-binding protein-related protein 8 n=1 Tax=Eurytemora carolleeae TaxID=1294199 RepID=UPI000C7872F1|nr:oxysterol-binding protein-related protein 8 [Eurytemora carolleeae]|eukprot:XP_023324783.1 oxysterol-binding protein-related protein 8-like [Eurytemora affinis]